MRRDEQNTYKDHNCLLGDMMEISYDKEADAVYIRFKEGQFVRNKKLNDTTILDLDKSGNILGIELLQVSKRLPESLAGVSVKNLPVLA
jgi:uncharacterized protein YuzE